LAVSKSIIYDNIEWFKQKKDRILQSPTLYDIYVNRLEKSIKEFDEYIELNKKAFLKCAKESDDHQAIEETSSNSGDECVSVNDKPR
jgi:hypothetical protein